MVFYACVYQKLAETDCRCKIGCKWRLHDVAVGIPLGAHVYLKGGMGWNDRK